MAGVSGMNTDSMRRPSSSSRRSLRGAVGGELVADDAAACETELLRQRGAQRLAEVRHRADVRLGAPVDPAVDLAGVKTGDSPESARALLELAQFQFGQVEAEAWH